MPISLFVATQTGNFTRAEALPVMQQFLQTYKAGTDFQGVVIQNDDMGLGAIEAMKAAGVKPGRSLRCFFLTVPVVVSRQWLMVGSKLTLNAIHYWLPRLLRWL